MIYVSFSGTLNPKPVKSGLEGFGESPGLSKRSAALGV